MSQRIVFEILSSFDKGATRTELKEEIEHKYPKRSLSQYLGQRLSTLVEKSAVFKTKNKNKTIYRINPDYTIDDLGVLLSDFDSGVGREKLDSLGINVTNIVGNGEFCSDINLQALATNILQVEYEPETSPMAVWRPFDRNAATVLIPSSGRITIVGCKSRDEIHETVSRIYDDLPQYANNVISEEEFLAEFQISNIATAGSLNRELELSEVAIGIGLEDTEYNPNKFPGVIYRPRPGVVTLIFRSGSVVITANSYTGILDGWRSLQRELRSIGVQID